MPNAVKTYTSIVAQVPSTDGKRQYEVRQHQDGSWSCSCPAWRNQHNDAQHRKCKHMEQLVTSLGGHVVGVYNL